MNDRENAPFAAKPPLPAHPVGLVGSPASSYIDGMGKKQEERRDRYDVSGNIEAEYVDAAQTVLRNKPGVKAILLLFRLSKSRPLQGHTVCCSRKCAWIRG